MIKLFLINILLYFVIDLIFINFMFNIPLVYFYNCINGVSVNTSFQFIAANLTTTDFILWRSYSLIGKPLLTVKSGNRSSLNRAQSMKTAPRTPSPQSPVEATNTVIKFGTVRHMHSIIGQSISQPLASSAQNSRSRPALNGRPTAPPPSVSILQNSTAKKMYVKK